MIRHLRDRAVSQCLDAMAEARLAQSRGEIAAASRASFRGAAWAAAVSVLGLVVPDPPTPPAAKRERPATPTDRRWN